MSNKHITIKELNNEGAYDTLYPNTSATQVPLSDTTSQLFGQSGLNTDAALYKIIEKLRTDKKITVRVTDSNGNPVQGAKINGLLNSPTTSANGTPTININPTTMIRFFFLLLAMKSMIKPMPAMIRAVLRFEPDFRIVRNICKGWP